MPSRIDAEPVFDEAPVAVTSGPDDFGLPMPRPLVISLIDLYHDQYRDWSTGGLPQLLGVSWETFERILLGDPSLSDSTKHHVADRLGVAVDDILEFRSEASGASKAIA
jgi:hypothetical protein